MRDTNLIRAGKNKQKEEAIRKRQTTDVCAYPFVFPTGPQGHRRYALYDTFFCTFPASQDQTTRSDTAPADGDILLAYTAWMSRTKTDYPLHSNLINYLSQEDKTIIHLDTVCALHHFLISSKFAYGGYIMSADDGDAHVTLVYYRAYPTSTEGLIVDPNIFFLREAQRDVSTHCQISDQWSGDMSELCAQPGVDTDIDYVPLDKCLYATVTAYLKPNFQAKTAHMTAN